MYIYNNNNKFVYGMDNINKNCKVYEYKNIFNK